MYAVIGSGAGQQKVAEGETDQGYFYAANNFSAAEHGGSRGGWENHPAHGGEV